MQNKVGSAGFEAGVNALSTLAQYEITKWSPAGWQRLGQAINVGFVGGTVADNYPLCTTPAFCSMSRFDFSGQLREEGHIAVEFLRQTTYYCPGRHYLAVDYLKQFHRVDAQFSTQPEDVGAPGRAQSANMLAELIDLRIGHFG
jgi:hypothetical protein